jgi:hypothetical protein
MVEGHQQVLLSALMNGRADLPVDERDFTEPNRTIFQAWRRLSGNRGLLAVQDELKRLRKFKQVGGEARLSFIYNLTHDPDSVAYALEEVLEASRERLAREVVARYSKGELTAEELHQLLAEILARGAPAGEEPIDEFPEPPSEVAFHGLAGDIVRAVSPHTEASDVALLIQVLAVFGNVIGRNAYALADAARHYMNLFVVLVGETSKSRKGTSWAHIWRIFRRTDEDWAKNCISNGLSSGEGVIWNVRDAITTTASVRKGKKKGKRKKAEPDEEGLRTRVIDAGVSDKRLCVVEGEFAQVLKVMSREGNTLSPVIRSAWDSGNLRSMTKNSPARATGAHVSIIGHITRDEQRRLLTETEAANGFANRFPFLAVRRSKILPEGGHIEDENLNALVKRLHEAIEFARTAGKITRSAEARKLWAACYEQLSEGKRGMLGAITARAEAQVLRLSCLFALLDCSTTIGLDHHRAAMALWNYAEQSARWIFGAVTGDQQADRILAALRAAGRNGMTQTQIVGDVFSRHITSAELSSALRILEQSGFARPVVERTGERGAPATKWFATT